MTGKLPPNRFVTLLALLTPELIQQEMEVGVLATKCEELENDLHRKGELVEELYNEKDRHFADQRKIQAELSELRAKVRNMSYTESDLASANNRIKLQETEIAALTAKLNLLIALHPEDASKTVKDALFTYLTGDGRKTWEKGEKIFCIKNVRTLTGWGLKEAKDFVECLVWSHMRTEAPYYNSITKQEINRACTASRVEQLFSAEEAHTTDTSPTIGEVIKAKLGPVPNAK